MLLLALHLPACLRPSVRACVCVCVGVSAHLHALKSILMPSVHTTSDVLSQASPAQKNLGTSGEVEVMQPAQSSASRTQAVGVASQLRTAAFKLLLMGCRSSGAAFIKWGQWSATREDIFPAVSTAVSTLLSGPLLEGTSSL